MKTFQYHSLGCPVPPPRRTVRQKYELLVRSELRQDRLKAMEEEREKMMNELQKEISV